MKGMTIDEAIQWRIRMSALGLTEVQITGIGNTAMKLQKDTILTAKAFATTGEEALSAGKTYEEAITAMHLHHGQTLRRMKTGR